MVFIYSVCGLYSEEAFKTGLTVDYRDPFNEFYKTINQSWNVLIYILVLENSFNIRTNMS